MQSNEFSYNQSQHRYEKNGNIFENSKNKSFGIYKIEIDSENKKKVNRIIKRKFSRVKK